MQDKCWPVSDGDVGNGRSFLRMLAQRKGGGASGEGRVNLGRESKGRKQKTENRKQKTENR